LWTKSIGEAPASLGASAKHCVVARRDDKGEGYARHDLVFADERGEPLHADAVSKQWQRATAQVNAAWMAEAKAGGTEPTRLPVMRLYDARHTCATLLLEAGVPMRVVQDEKS
jgi:integrase